MLEHVPQWLGKALRGVRAGTGRLSLTVLLVVVVVTAVVGDSVGYEVGRHFGPRLIARRPRTSRTTPRFHTNHNQGEGNQ